MTITISRTITEKVPLFTIAALSFTASVTSSEVTDACLAEEEISIRSCFSDLPSVLADPRISAARDGYKAFGKDPSRYRLAAESLLRRVVKGHEFYRISNVVDLGNVLSARIRRSVAVLDADRIEGDVRVRLGRADDVYEGIGRGRIDIENVPLYEDARGPFGSTTSDTLRTSITEDTTHVLLFIIGFTPEGLDADLALAQELYTRFAHGTGFARLPVRKE